MLTHKNGDARAVCEEADGAWAMNGNKAEVCSETKHYLAISRIILRYYPGR